MSLQLNLSTTATFGTEESDLCREVAFEERTMDYGGMDCRPKKNGCCGEVSISEGSTVLGTAQVKISR